MGKIAVLMGSKNDFQQLSVIKDILSEFEIEVQFRVMSAHRTPEKVVEFIKQAENNDIKVFIAAAGMAAHLGGVIAAHTVLPVIGIPVDAGSLNGLDALLSTVQMPGGIPVATVGIGKAGAKNAALLAVQILSIADTNLLDKMKQYRVDMKAKIVKDDIALQQELK